MIIKAFALTMGLFCSLTLFTLYTATDFTFLGPFLWCGLMMILWQGAISYYFGDSLGRSFWTWFGIMLFCIYIVFDTQQIVSRYNKDEYIDAALALYLDIVNLLP
eukprot:UN00663